MKVIITPTGHHLKFSIDDSSDRIFQLTITGNLTRKAICHLPPTPQSDKLVEKMYSWRGYTVPMNDTDPSITVVSQEEEIVLGTISVGLDSDKKLFSDRLFKQEVNFLRSQNLILCEFTKLAVDKTQNSNELLAKMFHIAYIYAKRIHGCTDLLIEVNPRHVSFYKRMLGFSQIGDEKPCPRVGGAPAVLLRLDFNYAHEQIKLYGEQKNISLKRSLYPLVFSAAQEEEIVEQLLR